MKPAPIILTLLLAGCGGHVANLASVGMTFGGDFAGHGVYAVGGVRFALLDFSVT